MKRSNELPAIGAATLGTGAALTAAVASVCCVGPAIAPVILWLLGAGGLIALAQLRPFTPLLLLAAAAMLALSFYRLYRANARTLATRIARGAVWIAAVLWCTSAAFAVYGLYHE